MIFKFYFSLSLSSLLIAILTNCSSANYSQNSEVKKSLYLNKRYMKFVVDNGPSYRDIKLSNGGFIHYWRSDFGNLIASARNWDNSLDYCELVIKTNKKQIIKKIAIINNSINCAGVLK